MKIPLSVVVITKNEEGRIKDCLESVHNWAEELIVVDDESTDKTREIAQVYAGKVLVKKMDVEGKHRNWAYNQSKYDWVLSLDADERVTPELREEITGVLGKSFLEGFTPLEKATLTGMPGCLAPYKADSSFSPDANPAMAEKPPSAPLDSKRLTGSAPTIREQSFLTGFTIPRKNFLGSCWLQWGGQYPAPQLKLFRKDKFKWEEVEVHPRAFLEGECGHLKSPLLHYTYRDFGDFIKKLNSQTTLEAKKWINLYKVNPRKANYKMNGLHVFWRCLDRFIRTYFVKRGFKDGFIGFMVAFFASLYQIVSYAKYWEMKKQISKLGGRCERSFS